MVITLLFFLQVNLALSSYYVIIRFKLTLSEISERLLTITHVEAGRNVGICFEILHQSKFILYYHFLLLEPGKIYFMLISCGLFVCRRHVNRQPWSWRQDCCLCRPPHVYSYRRRLSWLPSSPTDNYITPTRCVSFMVTNIC